MGSVCGQPSEQDKVPGENQPVDFGNIVASEAHEEQEKERVKSQNKIELVKHEGNNA